MCIRDSSSSSSSSSKNIVKVFNFILLFRDNQNCSRSNVTTTENTDTLTYTEAIFTLQLYGIRVNNDKK